MAITIEMIDKGWKAGLVTLQEDPLSNKKGKGVVCRIGEYWFYFAGSEGEDMTVGEYMRDVPKDDIVKEILDALKSLDESTENGSRMYNYYEAVLRSADEPAARASRANDNPAAPGMPEKPGNQGIGALVAEALKSADIENLVRGRVAEAIENAIDESCKAGKVRTVLREKIESAMVPVLEGIDFGQYVSNLDAALSELSKELSVKANNNIVNNLKALVSEDIPESGTMAYAALFDEYAKFAAEEVDEGDLEEDPDDGYETYSDVVCRAELEYIEHDNPARVERYAVRFVTGTPNGVEQETKYGSPLNASFELMRWPGIDKPGHYAISLLTPPSLLALSNLSTFESRLMALSRGRVRVMLTEDDIKNREIRVFVSPKATPG